jgi:ACT domain-containing protein
MSSPAARQGKKAHVDLIVPNVGLRVSIYYKYREHLFMLETSIGVNKDHEHWVGIQMC